MDLSKGFDRINHEPLITKLHGHGFSKDSLEIILGHLSNRYQRVKINKRLVLGQNRFKGYLIKVLYMSQFYLTLI